MSPRTATICVLLLLLGGPRAGLAQLSGALPVPLAAATPPSSQAPASPPRRAVLGGEVAATPTASVSVRPAVDLAVATSPLTRRLAQVSPSASATPSQAVSSPAPAPTAEAPSPAPAAPPAAPSTATLPTDEVSSTPKASSPADPAVPTTDRAPASPEASSQDSASLESTASPYYYQGRLVGDIQLVALGRLKARPLRELVVVRVGQPLSLREVSRTIELFYRLGAIEDVLAEVELRPDGSLTLRFKVWPSILVHQTRFRGNRLVGSRRLGEQVSLRQGSPYTWEAAKSQAAALKRFYQQEGFLNARVTARPTPSRGGAMDVLFEIQEGEQARIRAILFQGNEAMPPRQLQQVTALEEERRFRPVELEDKRKLLQELYRGEKYLGARVKASVEYDDRREWATLHFDIEEGPRIRLDFWRLRPPPVGPLSGVGFGVYHKVRNALVRGGDNKPSRVEWFRRRELLNMLDLEGEQQFTAGFSEEAAERIQAYLTQEGFEGPKVTSQQLSTPDGRDVTFRFLINPGRKVRIQRVAFAGNAFFDQQLLEEVFAEAMQRFAPEDVYTKEAFDQALPLMADYYRSQGFLDIRLSPQVTIQEGPFGPRARVDIAAEEGPRTLVSEVTLTGNQVVPISALQPLISLTEGEPYDPNRVRQTIERIRAYYAARGYVYAQVSYGREPKGADKTSVGVHFEVDEGPLARFGEIVVRGTRRTRPFVINRELTIRTGEVYEPQRIEETRQRLNDLGLFQRASIYPMQGERVRDMMVEVLERKARTVGVSGGILLDGSGLDLSTARFDATLEFNHYNLFGLAHHLNARLEFASTYLPQLRGWVPGEDIFQYATVVGQDLQSYFLKSSSRRAVFTYRSPYLFGLRVGSVGTLTILEREQLPAYLLYRNSLGWAVSSSRKGGLNGSLQLQGTVRRPDAEQTDPAVQLWDIDRQQRLLLLASSALIFDKRNSRLDPSRGYLLNLQAELDRAYRCQGEWDSFTPCGLDVLLPEEAFVRVAAAAQGLVSVFSWLRLESRLQAGYAHPFGGEAGAIPVERRFYLGGASTVRGFKQGSLGPVLPRQKTLPESVLASWTLIPTGGNAMLAYSIEAQAPLKPLWSSLDGWELAVFHDGGNVYWLGDSLTRYQEVATASSSPYDLGQEGDFLRFSVGVGLRYRSSIGPIRFDLGFPLRRRAALEEAWALHFSIGLL